MTTSAVRVSGRRIIWATAMDDGIHSLLKDIPQMSQKQRDESEQVLEDLQRAVEEHEKILRRQAELIARLRMELKGVNKGG